MAKREKGAGKKGFQIPIEDGADDTATDAGAEANEAADPADSTSDPDASASRPASDGHPKEPAEAPEAAESAPGAAGDAPDAPESPEADEAVPTAAGADEAASDADDIVAEAEKVVAAAAEGLSGDDELEQARQEASDWQDRYLRLHAEWDTYRRRTSEQRSEERARATEKLMEDLLPVLDDFERTVSYAEENGETGLLDGVKAVQSKLIASLTKGGLEVIDPAGEAYDALEAQAVGTVPDDSVFEETVRDVYQKGYKMGKKVLRPAMVTVTTGGAPRPKD